MINKVTICLNTKTHTILLVFLLLKRHWQIQWFDIFNFVTGVKMCFDRDTQQEYSWPKFPPGSDDLKPKYIWYPCFDVNWNTALWTKQLYEQLQPNNVIWVTSEDVPQSMNQNGVNEVSRELFELCNSFPATSLFRSAVIMTLEFIWSLFALNFDLFIYFIWESTFIVPW